MAALTIEAGWTQVTNSASSGSYSAVISGFTNTNDATPSFATTGGTSNAVVAIQFEVAPDLVLESGWIQLTNEKASLPGGNGYASVIAAYGNSGDTTPTFTTTGGGIANGIVGIQFAAQPTLAVESGWTQVTNAASTGGYAMVISGFTGAADTTPSFTTTGAGTANAIVAIQFSVIATPGVNGAISASLAPLTASTTGSLTAGATDPHSSNVTSLLHFNEVGGTPVDQIASNTWALSGTAAISNANPIFGGGSLVTDASDGSMVKTTNVPGNWNFGTDDFTVELALNLGTTQANEFPVPIEVGDGYGNVTWQFYFDNNYYGSYNVYWWTPTINIGSASVYMPYWNGAIRYLAYSRVAGVGSLYVDGVRVGTGPDTVNYVGGSILTVGKASTGYNQCAAKFDEVRITKGVGRYTGTGYTLQAAEFPTGSPATPVSGTISTTLAPLTASATGTARVNGVASTTLAALTATAAGSVKNNGSVSVALSPLTASITGSINTGTSGAINTTVAPLTASAAGNIKNNGLIVATLSPLTASASGSVRSSGAFSSTLAPLTASVVATLRVSGTAGSTFAPLTGSMNGAVGNSPTGSINAMFEPLTASLTGTATLPNVVQTSGGGIWTAADERKHNRRLNKFRREQEELLETVREGLYGKAPEEVQEAVAVEVHRIESMLPQLMLDFQAAAVLAQLFIEQLEDAQAQAIQQYMAVQAEYREFEQVLIEVARTRARKNRLAILLRQ